MATPELPKEAKISERYYKFISEAVYEYLPPDGKFDKASYSENISDLIDELSVSRESLKNFISEKTTEFSQWFEKPEEKKFIQNELGKILDGDNDSIRKIIKSKYGKIDLSGQILGIDILAFKKCLNQEIFDSFLVRDIRDHSERIKKIVNANYDGLISNSSKEALDLRVNIAEKLLSNIKAAIPDLKRHHGRPEKYYQILENSIFQAMKDCNREKPQDKFPFLDIHPSKLVEEVIEPPKPQTQAEIDAEIEKGKSWFRRNVIDAFVDLKKKATPLVIAGVAIGGAAIVVSSLRDKTKKTQDEQERVRAKAAKKQAPLTEILAGDVQASPNLAVGNIR